MGTRQGGLLRGPGPDRLPALSARRGCTGEWFGAGWEGVHSITGENPLRQPWTSSLSVSRRVISVLRRGDLDKVVRLAEQLLPRGRGKTS